MCVCEREIREVGERGRKNRKFYRSSNHENRERDIVGKIMGEMWVRS